MQGLVLLYQKAGQRPCSRKNIKEIKITKQEIKYRGSGPFFIVVIKVFVSYHMYQKPTINLNILMVNKINRNLEWLLYLGQRIAFQ